MVSIHWWELLVRHWKCLKGKIGFVISCCGGAALVYYLNPTSIFWHHSKCVILQTDRHSSSEAKAKCSRVVSASTAITLMMIIIWRTNTAFFGCLECSVNTQMIYERCTTAPKTAEETIRLALKDQTYFFVPFLKAFADYAKRWQLMLKAALQRQLYDEKSFASKATTLKALFIDIYNHV